MEWQKAGAFGILILLCAALLSLLVPATPLIQPSITHPWDGMSTGTGAGNVVCNQTLDTPGALYTMNASSTINGSTCFTVTAANVTLNCAGHSITGNNSSSTYGIYSSQFNTTVKNCNISNFETGIGFNGATNGTMSNTNASSTKAGGNGIQLFSSNYNQIANSTATATTSSAFAMLNSTGSSITGTTGTSTSGAGLEIKGGSANTISNSNGTSSFGTGIYSSSSTSTFTGVKGTSTYSVGMQIETASNTNITSSTMLSSGVVNTSISCPSNMSYIPKLGAGGYCIDRYEASDGGGGKAASQVGAVPWVSINQSNANAACVAAGKYLCTDAQWLGAADMQGQYYNLPTNLGYAPYNCVVNSGAAALTGSQVGCSSNYLVYDMVGNVWEWTNGTVTTIVPSPGTEGWYFPSDAGWITTQTDTKYGYDGVYFYAGTQTGRAVVRGGAWVSGAHAGPFYAYLSDVPSFTYGGIGFRCCSGSNLGSGISAISSVSDAYAGFSSINSPSAISITNSTNIKVSNSTLTANYTCSMLDDKAIGGTFLNNTMIGTGTASLMAVATTASNNTFCLNNFTATTGAIVQDYNGSNHYNCTYEGKNQGNIYTNVMNNSVLIAGENISSIAGLYIGNLGPGFPYSNTTSLTKFSCNFAGCQDNAPLTFNTPNLTVDVWNGTNFTKFVSATQLNFKCGNPPQMCSPINQNSTQSIFRITTLGVVPVTQEQMRLNTTWATATMLCSPTGTTPYASLSTTYINCSATSLTQNGTLNMYLYLNVTSVPSDFVRAFHTYFRVR